jgi:hypothetical protein
MWEAVTGVPLTEDHPPLLLDTDLVHSYDFASGFLYDEMAPMQPAQARGQVD